jgi:adenylyltransferase/sulfurtransferase
MLDPQTLSFYSRQLGLPGWGSAGQNKLQQSTVAIMGAGGLGCPAALYLAAMGVGRLVLVDRDRVERSNLHRQILFEARHIGEIKAVVAARVLQERYPTCRTEAIHLDLMTETQELSIPEAQVVLDCTDNFAARRIINQICLQRRLPLVSAAAVRLSGQLAVFDSRKQHSPCYDCLYGRAEGGESCETAGILPAVAGMLACLQVIETTKLLLDMGETLCGRLLLVDAATMAFRTINLPRDPACPTCAQLR